MTRLPWGYQARHCIYCGRVGPRVQVHGGYAHKYCLPDDLLREHNRKVRSAGKKTSKVWKVIRCRDKTGITNNMCYEIYEGTNRVCVMSGYDSKVALDRAQNIVDAMNKGRSG